MEVLREEDVTMWEGGGWAVQSSLGDPSACLHRPT